MIGIYSITNTKNGRVYIGESDNIDHRWNRHRYHLKRGQHSNSKLQQDWNNQDGQGFEFAIIHLCQTSQLAELELSTIREMQRAHDLYNKYEGDPEAASNARRQMTTDDFRDGIPAQEAAQILNINPRTFRRMIERGSVNAFKMDPSAKSVYRIPAAEIQRILGERTNTNNPAG